MKTDDLSGNRGIAGLTRLMRALADCRGPGETLSVVIRGMQEAFGPSTFAAVSTRGLGAGEYRLMHLRINGEVRGVSEDPWGTADFPVYSGGPIGRIIQSPNPQLVQEVDWSGDAHLGSMLGEYCSLIAVPLAGRNLPIDWSILLRPRETAFVANELVEAVMKAALIGSLLDSRALAEELAKAHARIDQEVEQVAALQRALLPNPIPAIPGLEIAASYETCGRAGGDLYDVFGLPEEGAGGRWCIFVGDAAGHGAAAAVMMAMVQTLLRAYPARPARAGEMLAHVNAQLCRRGVQGSFVTAFLGLYDARTRMMSYSSAGHPAPLLFGGCTPAREVGGGLGAPLGIVDGLEYPEATLEFEGGRTILIYTDGIPEARGRGREFLGIERLRAALHECGGGAAETIERVRRLLAEHQGERSPTDDQTAVAVASVES